MTYQGLTEVIRWASLEEPNVRYVGFDDVYRLNAMPSIDYCVVYAILNSVSSTIDGQTFRFTLYYIDRWDETEENQSMIWSAGISALNNIVRKINEQTDGILWPITHRPFWQKFKDVCAGVMCDVDIVVPAAGYCAE